MSSNIDEKLEILKKNVNSYPDFPKKGVIFRDVFSILRNPDIFQILKDVLVETTRNLNPPVDYVIALDARGFLFGPLISLELKLPFVPVRKKGKLPGNVASVSYSLEYGKDVLEIQADSIEKGKRVLIVDDLLATGGSMKAACDLVNQLGSEIAACLVIIELEELNGRKLIPANVISLLKF